MTSKVYTVFRYFPRSPRDADWGSYVTTAGEATIPPGAAYPPDGHPSAYQFKWSLGRTIDEFQAIYISAGRGWFASTDVSRRKIESGDLFLLFPGVWHQYTPDESTGWSEHWLGFDGNFARNLLAKGFLDSSNPVVRVRQQLEMARAFAAAKETIIASPPATQQLLAGLTSYVLSLAYSSRYETDPSAAGAGQAVLAAIQLFEEHPEQDHDLEALAARLHVSYTSFRRTFVHHTGMPPRQYLIQIRLAKARELLAATTLSVKEIAFRTGFSDEHYFFRTFKRHAGMTAVAWRTRIQRRGE